MQELNTEIILLAIIYQYHIYHNFYNIGIKKPFINTGIGRQVPIYNRNFHIIPIIIDIIFW